MIILLVTTVLCRVFYPTARAMDSELPIYYSKSGRRFPRKAVMARDSDNLGTRIKPSQVKQFEVSSKAFGGICFVDLPYVDSSSNDDDNNDEDENYSKVANFKVGARSKSVAFIKGRPKTIFFSDRLDSGLCRPAPRSSVLTTDSSYTTSKIGFRDEDYRAWMELEIPPGRSRLSKTRVLLAHHQIVWKSSSYTREESEDSDFQAMLECSEIVNGEKSQNGDWIHTVYR